MHAARQHVILFSNNKPFPWRGHEVAIFVFFRQKSQKGEIDVKHGPVPAADQTLINVFVSR